MQNTILFAYYLYKNSTGKLQVYCVYSTTCGMLFALQEEHILKMVIFHF